MSASEQDRERAKAWIERNVPEAPKAWVADNSPFTRGIVKKDAVDLLAREFAADRERIAALERERDEARQKLWDMGMTCAVCEQYGDGCLCGGVAALKAHAARLREALEHLLAEWNAWQPGLTGVAKSRAERALAETPAEALAAIRASVWEEAAKVADDAEWIHGQDAAVAARASEGRGQYGKWSEADGAMRAAKSIAAALRERAKEVRGA